jgi:hypothetical protein
VVAIGSEGAAIRLGSGENLVPDRVGMRLHICP